MRYFKMFVAGLIFPSILLPFLLLIAYLSHKTQPLTLPFIHFIPLIWGVWNILYFTLFLKFLPKNIHIGHLITGAVLGLLVALYGIFALHLPTILGFPHSITYLPLIVLPILYALFWHFCVHPCNKMLGLKKGS